MSPCGDEGRGEKPFFLNEVGGRDLGVVGLEVDLDWEADAVLTVFFSFDREGDFLSFCTVSATALSICFASEGR